MLKLINLELKYLIVIAVAFMLLTYRNNNDNSEHLDNTEAIQALASIYNTSNAVLGNLEVNNLTVRGTANVAADMVIGNDIVLNKPSNKWIIHTPNDARKSLFIAPRGATDWDWPNSYSYNNNGDMTVSGAISTGKDINVGNNLVLGGSNSWILHTPNDGRKTMYIAPRGETDWDWGNMMWFDNNGVTNFKNITARKVGLNGWNIENDTENNLTFKKDGLSPFVKFDGNSTANIMKVGTTNATGGIVSVIQSHPARRPDRGSHDGGIWKFNSSGSDWGV